MTNFAKLLLFFSCFIFNKVQAQQGRLDSLHQLAQRAMDDSARLHAYNLLGFFYVESNRDSTLLYLDKSLQIARKLKMKLAESTFLDFRGYTYMLKGNYPKSLESSLQALKIAENPASEKAPGFSDPQNRRVTRLKILSNIHYNMGLLFGATGNKEKEIANYRQATTIAASIGDENKQAEINLSLSETYLSVGKKDSALLTIKKAMAVLLNTTKPTLIKYKGNVFCTLAKIYQQQGKIDSSNIYFHRALKHNLATNNLANLADAYLALAGLKSQLHQQDSALAYGAKAAATFKSMGTGKGIYASYNLLANVYNIEHKTDSAFAFSQLANALRDSLDIVERKNINEFQNIGFDEQLRLQYLEKEKIQAQGRIRTYSLIAGLAVVLLIAFILLHNNRQKKSANRALKKTLADLKSTQSQLIQSEKMASLGELTAGIAHEIQNPLNFVNNFSEVSTELVDEMNEEITKGNLDDAKEIAGDLKQNLEKINHHGKRAGEIVKGMLQHSRSSTGVKEPTDINALCDEYLRLAYHGLRAKDKSFNAEMKMDFYETIGNINIIPQDIGRVILNLITNAFYAVNEKSKQNITGYEPIVDVSTKKEGNKVLITVKDNGNGIPDKIKDKIFQPFFTTKPTGQGTGLGLSLSYDIIKAHGGEIKVKSKEGEGCEFIIQLPVD